MGMNEQRREFVKKLAYVTPVVLTFLASPSFARVGSGPQADTGAHPEGPPSAGTPR